LRPHQKKLQEFEVKNRRKSAEEAKEEHLLLLLFTFFDSNKARLALETHSSLRRFLLKNAFLYLF